MAAYQAIIWNQTVQIRDNNKHHLPAVINGFRLQILCCTDWYELPVNNRGRKDTYICLVMYAHPVCTHRAHLFRVYGSPPITCNPITITWNTHANHLRPMRWHADLNQCHLLNPNNMIRITGRLTNEARLAEQAGRFIDCLFSCSPLFCLWTLFNSCIYSPLALFVTMQAASWAVSCGDIWRTLWASRIPTMASNPQHRDGWSSVNLWWERVPRHTTCTANSTVAVNIFTPFPFPDTGALQTMNCFYLQNALTPQKNKHSRSPSCRPVLP